MRRMLGGLSLLVLVGVTGMAAGGGSAAPLGAPAELPAHLDKRVCQHAGGDLAECTALVVTQADGASPLATTSYLYGLNPANLASAYKWPSPASANWVWNGQTVAIVDAYDNPNAASDLAAYRTQFGLPPCTTANGCFRKVNQRGTSTPPSPNVGWGQEIDLDIEMVSAVCPGCKILLVEADSNAFTDLGAAVNQAATLGANAISNSYGTSSEFSSETSYEGYYNHPRIAVTVSSGDSGYGTEFPAVSRYVVAVGGTSLASASNSRGWSESAWSGAGSGCSSLIPKPSWQHDAGCGSRTVADVAAVADPNTGVAVYDSYGSSGGANWYVFGGTSVASPIIAAVYGLAANAGTVNDAATLPYGHPSSLFDVTTGSNGNCARGKKPGNSSAAYLCTAGPGYDGPTGLGTPNGTGGF
jgi:subtilase family serine protease